MDIREILDFMPHRYPILLIDRIEEINENSVVAKKNITYNEPIFQGHFPDNPIFPGVLIVESMAQAAAVLLHNGRGFKKEEKDTYFMGIEKVKFKKPVKPGDSMMLDVEIVQEKRLKKGIVLKLKGKAKVDSKVVTTGSLTVGAFDKS
ncbi:MAG: 3-hydroxyacyl-ACP dehydratase FabZ [Candidatus Mcinerneyibacterium aminivorans]|uniref:3-hydroxyacyl-[acyl-carrier-protein] dehydratase FabZ n=1 Tax=Candidatus Mcinerneyibacterium aminivorans TaxID=2703815 RepID=A0A5D0MIX9_9BACT|nr:MAG: 3-hydroxyacyl-ACP dehydratase FabZ [Candidatus Mcinerneyibacterium aminivorans]